MAEVSQIKQLSAARLRVARLGKGLSLAEAADRVGVSKSTWQKWEDGSPPSATVAARVAALLGETVESLWGENVDTDAPTEAA